MTHRVHGFAHERQFLMLEELPDGDLILYIRTKIIPMEETDLRELARILQQYFVAIEEDAMIERLRESVKFAYIEGWTDFNEREACEPDWEHSNARKALEGDE